MSCAALLFAFQVSALSPADSFPTRVDGSAFPDSLPSLPEAGPSSMEAAISRVQGEPLRDPLSRDSVESPAEPPRLESIGFLHHGALEGSKSVSKGDSLVYVWADWLRDHVLHNRTREATIERRLLFHAGEPLDSLRLAESERLLRQEKFLADARVTTIPNGDGTARAKVETWDRWSTSVISGLNRSGGEINWILGLSEANVLGSGRALSGYYQSTAQRTSWNFGLLDNAFPRQGHMLSLNFSQASDGNVYSARFGRPLNSRYQELAWMIEFDDAVFDRHVWADAPEWNRLRRTYPGITSKDWGGEPAAQGGWDIHDLETFSTHPIATYQGTHTQKVRGWLQKVWGSDIQMATGPLIESQFDSAGAWAVWSGIPKSLRVAMGNDPRWEGFRDASPEVDDRRLGWMGTVRHDRWIRRKNFNNLKWVEDIPVGWLVESSVARAVVSRGEDRDGTWIATSGRWSGLLEQTYATASASWVRRFGGESPFPDRQGLSWKSEIRRMPATNLQLLATASGDLVADAPVTSQLTLGEDNGLPGFPARSFAGETRNLFGSEVRWTPPLEAFTMVPALAAFAAAGRAGGEIRPLGSGEWHYGAGVGIRLGLTRSISGVVNHLSISRPLGPEGGDWTNTRSWMVSFGAKQSL